MSVKRSIISPFSLGVVPGLVLVIGILYLAKAVLVPLALAILLTILLAPIVRTIQHVTIRRIPAVILTVLIAFGVLATIGWAAGSQLNELAKELPQQKEKIRAKIQVLRDSDSTVGRILRMARELSNETEHHLPQSGDQSLPSPKPLIVSENSASNLSVFTNTLVPFLDPLITFGLVVILVIFMLVEREDLRDRLIAIVGQGKLTTTTRMIDDATTRLSRYLITQSAINLGFGILLSVGLLVIGVPYAYLWGILAGLLRFVPYLGTWIAAFFPIVLSFALSPDWSQPIVVAIFYVVLELTTGNVIEPYLFGQRVGVIPITLLVAAVFWTWLWGAIGLVLSTPLTVCLIVMAQNFPKLRFLTVLMSDQAALTPHVRYYQRLLARDQEEARELVQEHVKKYGMENVCDHLLLPALLMAQRDHRDANLTEPEEDYVVHQTEEFVKLLEGENAPQANEKTEPSTNGHAKAIRRVVILGPAGMEAVEEVALEMFGAVMKGEECRVDVVSVDATREEIDAQMKQDKPAAILIPALPPRNVSLLCKLCRDLRNRLPEIPVIVGLWGVLHAGNRPIWRIRSAGASSVTLTLRQTRENIHAILNPAPRKKSLIASAQKS